MCLEGHAARLPPPQCEPQRRAGRPEQPGGRDQAVRWLQPLGQVSGREYRGAGAGGLPGGGTAQSSPGGEQAVPGPEARHPLWLPQAPGRPPPSGRTRACLMPCRWQGELAQLRAVGEALRSLCLGAVICEMGASHPQGRSEEKPHAGEGAARPADCSESPVDALSQKPGQSHVHRPRGEGGAGQEGEGPVPALHPAHRCPPAPRSCPGPEEALARAAASPGRQGRGGRGAGRPTGAGFGEQAVTHSPTSSGEGTAVRDRPEAIPANR